MVGNVEQSTSRMYEDERAWREFVREEAITLQV